MTNPTRVAILGRMAQERKIDLKTSGDYLLIGDYLADQDFHCQLFNGMPRTLVNIFTLIKDGEKYVNSKRIRSKT